MPPFNIRTLYYSILFNTTPALFFGKWRIIWCLNHVNNKKRRKKNVSLLELNYKPRRSSVPINLTLSPSVFN